MPNRSRISMSRFCGNLILVLPLLVLSLCECEGRNLVPHQQDLSRGRIIVGGVEATPYEFPWIVSVQRSRHSCGGSILTSEWIITAAHCMISPPEAYTIIAGEHNLTVEEGREQLSGVEQIIVHGNYDPYYLENDIALMKLASPFTFNEQVQPIPLPPEGYNYTGTFTVAGWGRLSWQGPLPDVLMKVDVPFINLDTCRDVYPQDEHPVFDHNICAGYLEGEKDSCNGDSGGPLTCPGPNDSTVICGLVSWGGVGEGSCASPNEPGVYTAVSPFLNWIESNIGKQLH